MSPVFTSIGNACTDLIAKVDDAFLIKHNIPKSLCKFITNPEELADIKLQIGSYKSIGGGAGANVAQVISALGGDAHFISKIANDDVGLAFQADLEKNGVNCDFPVPSLATVGSPQVPTLITPDKERSFVSFDGVARDFSFEDYDTEILNKTDYLYLDGYCYVSPHTGKSYLKAADIVRSNGGHVTFNIGDINFYSSHKTDIDNLLMVCDSVMCSETEATILFGNFLTTYALVKHLSEKFLFGAITLGSKGAIAFHGDQIVEIPTNPNIRIVDTNGAGDHFSGGFIFGLMNGYTLEQSGKLGTLCAIDCLSHAGARPLGGFESLKKLCDLI